MSHVTVLQAKIRINSIRYVRLNYADEIPHDIMRICVAFYNAIEIIWDVFCDKVASCVSDDGLEVKVTERDPFSTFASSVGWNEGIHSYTLKQLDSGSYKFGPGIISSDELDRLASNNEDFFLSTQNKEACGYYLDKTNVYALQNGYAKFSFNFSSILSSIGQGDTVTIVVDCDKWKLTFYINDKIWKRSINIVEDKTYHAVFSVWEGRSVTLRLIETTIDVEGYDKDTKEL